MQIDWLGIWRAPFFDLPARQLEGFALLGVYGLALIVALVGTRRSWRQSRSRRWLLSIVLCLAALILNNVLTWHYQTARPPVPTRPQEPSDLLDPLLGSLPILLVGGWLGSGPAILAGLLGGLVRVLFISGQIPQGFEFAFFGLLAGFLLRQDYQGRFFSWLRQPLIAGPVARLLIWPLSLPGIYVHTPGEPLYALDFTWPLFLSGWLPALVEGILAGLGVQILYAIAPALRPVQAARSAPPYARSLNRRLLFTFVPVMIVLIAVLMYAVAATTINAATQQAIEQMARDATSATQDIPFFFQTGQNLVGALAGDAELRSNDSNIRQNRLAEGVRTGAFFDEMVLTDVAGQLTGLYPPGGSRQ
jgi:hypothetical protein